MPVIISNDPDVIVRQRLEEAEDYFCSKMGEVLALIIDGKITPAEGRERIAELDVLWEREMKEIEKIGASE